jgi:Xaa-Pro dipeptidase
VLTKDTVAEPANPANSASPSPGSLYAQHLGEMDRRVAAAISGTNAEGIVVFSGQALTRWRDDLSYPFQVEPYFKAWVPLLAHPGCWLRIIPGERPLLVLLQSEDFWHAPAEDPEGPWVPYIEVRYATDDAEARRQLGDLTRLAAIGPGLDPASFASLNDTRVLAYLDYFRAAKTRYEVSFMVQASRLAAIGHGAVRAEFEHRRSEFMLHQTYCTQTQQTDHELPYPSIVALNEHAAVLHYQRLEREPPSRLRTLLIDAGAQCNGYASDITRTWTGEPEHVSDEFRSLLAATELLQQALCAEVRPGVDFVDLNESAHRRLGELLHQAGLVHCDPDAAYELGLTRWFLPHGLGHLLGLQVHDVGGTQIDPEGSRRRAPAEHPFLRLTRILEPDYVITVEPGLYFIPSLLARLAALPARRQINWSMVEQLIPYGGIRIEDNVLVTAQGSTNLTRDAFASVQGPARERCPVL